MTVLRHARRAASVVCGVAIFLTITTLGGAIAAPYIAQLPGGAFA